LASVTAIYTVKFAPGAHAPAPIDEVLIGLAASEAVCNSRCRIMYGKTALQCDLPALGPLRTYVRVAFRPPPLLAYEQMFPSTNNSKLAQRTLGALRLTRSFLLLEDDHDVDWEVDRDEPVGQIHPHRVPLRGRMSRDRAASRRAGQPAPREHACVSPVVRPAHATVGAAKLDRRRRATRA
jgi:hypothetical protein